VEVGVEVGRANTVAVEKGGRVVRAEDTREAGEP